MFLYSKNPLKVIVSIEKRTHLQKETGRTKNKLIEILNYLSPFYSDTPELIYAFQIYHDLPFITCKTTLLIYCSFKIPLQNNQF